MAKPRKEFKWESNVSKVIDKVQDKPQRVLNIIGQMIVKETRGTLRQYYSKRTGVMDKSLGYWARKNEKDLQIGFKKFYAPFVLGDRDPIKPIVIKNKDLIAQTIAQALQEIEKE